MEKKKQKRLTIEEIGGEKEFRVHYRGSQSWRVESEKQQQRRNEYWVELLFNGNE